jgi:hypothetical protein
MLRKSNGSMVEEERKEWSAKHKIATPSVSKKLLIHQKQRTLKVKSYSTWACTGLFVLMPWNQKQYKKQIVP